ncbi:hypothetical protein CERSUDRAFT_101009 [Gelatoporia subvermispora B]|uniref:Uncharacterized protein n=1 Tax=Ceriporiopsis subvermispora (strain B) TaxID=914234 RepID=M2Q1S0_CERS8|nr:hypothetical protein CERSUDRAFT_101009 [Gelatoporia subvermispora B]
MDHDHAISNTMIQYFCARDPLTALCLRLASRGIILSRVRAKHNYHMRPPSRWLREPSPTPPSVRHLPFVLLASSPGTAEPRFLVYDSSWTVEDCALQTRKSKHAGPGPRRHTSQRRFIARPPSSGDVHAKAGGAHCSRPRRRRLRVALRGFARLCFPSSLDVHAIARCVLAAVPLLSPVIACALTSRRRPPRPVSPSPAHCRRSDDRTLWTAAALSESLAADNSQSLSMLSTISAIVPSAHSALRRIALSSTAQTRSTPMCCSHSVPRYSDCRRRPDLACAAAHLSNSVG